MHHSGNNRQNLEKTMSVWNDILAQVDNLQQVVEKLSTTTQPKLAQAAELLQNKERIIFTGVGSGLNATIPAYSYLMAKGCPAQTIDTTEAIYDMLPGFKNAGLVLNTRSGETAELVKLARLARQEGIPVVAVTNELDSGVARLAEISIPTHSRWDDLVVISAYGGMLVTELALAAQITGEFKTMLSYLAAAADASGAVLAQVIEKRGELLDLFKDVRPIYLLGRGASIASTLGGELVLEEMSRRPAVAMATGLFRQGPIEVADENFRAFCFSGSGERARLSANLVAELQPRGAKFAWVGPGQMEGALNISLPALPSFVLPILEIIPTHVLAYDLARYAGFEPGTVRYIQKVITSETGIPNENP
jgi:glucosamine--fructose-6-phosphate aminotransferase (isomerizing)